MNDLPAAFFTADPSDPTRFIPTELTRGPWDNRAQHGGPPCALLARAVAAFENPVVGPTQTSAAHGLPPVVHTPRSHAVARLTFALLRPVPLAPLRVSVHADRLGRAVHRLRGSLTTDDGRELVTVDALRIRQSPTHHSAPPEPAWPTPETAPPLVFNFFQHPVGYHRGVELRTAFGQWGRTPIGVWGRLAVPLVHGAPLTALETIVALSDAQSGMGVPLDPLRWTFVNPDLSVLLFRAPTPGWVGFDIQSFCGASGAGLAESALRDCSGPLGRAAQTLVVGERVTG